MGFLSDLLLFAARSAFYVLDALHALLFAWPEAFGVPQKNEILRKVVLPIIAAFCHTMCQPESGANPSDLKSRVSARQVLQLGVKNNWWSSIEPGASSIDTSECWLLQQGKDEVLKSVVSILPAPGLKGNCLVYSFITLQSD